MIMKRSISIPMAGYSINRTYYGNRAIMRPEAKNWMSEVLFHLEQEPNKTAISDLRESFDPELHAYHMTLVTITPAEILLNKKNMLSAKAFDITNTEKILIDTIFLPKHKPGVNLEVDDRYLNFLSSTRKIGKKYSLEITLEIVDLVESVALNSPNA